MDKAYELMKYPDPPIRTLSKYLHLTILRNPQKCTMLDPGEITLEGKDLSGIPQEDLYLFQIYYSTQADALVTTDERLAQSMPCTNADVIVRLRDEFLKEYLEAERL